MCLMSSFEEARDVKAFLAKTGFALYMLTTNLFVCSTTAFADDSVADATEFNNNVSAIETAFESNFQKLILSAGTACALYLIVRMILSPDAKALSTYKTRLLIVALVTFVGAMTPTLVSAFVNIGATAFTS